MTLQTTGAPGGTNQLAGQLRTYYRRSFIAELTPRVIYSAFGVPDSIPLREGRTISWPTMDPIPSGTNLTEGTDAAEQDLTLGAVTATLGDKGGLFSLSSRVSLDAPDPILEELIPRMANRARLDLDSDVRDTLDATTNVVYPGSHTADGTVTATDIVDADVIHEAVSILDGNDADPVMSMIQPTGLVGTVPGEEAYIAIAHADVCSDLRKNASSIGFESVDKYASGNNVFRGEVGKVGRVRFLSAGSAGVLDADAGATNVDLYSIHVFGEGAFGVVDHANRPVDIHVVPHSQLDSGNRMGRRGSVAWSAEEASAILVPEALLKIRVASSFGAN